MPKFSAESNAHFKLYNTAAANKFPADQTVEVGKVVFALYDQRDYCVGEVIKLDGDQARLRLTVCFDRDFNRYAVPAHKPECNVVAFSCGFSNLKVIK